MAATGCSPNLRQHWPTDWEDAGMSQPGPHSRPGPLDPADQEQLIQQIGRVIVGGLPPGWQEAGIEYRAIGSHSELVAQLVSPNGTAVPISAPTEAEHLFARLREGMYQEERGTWVSALYQLQRPGSYSVDFNGDYEPAWRTAPPSAAYAEELERYPRSAVNVPAWLAERSGLPAPAGTATRVPALRTAEVFDGSDASGSPVTDRPALPPEERDRVLDYLERAPIVLAARSYDPDQLSEDRALSVPMTFHTDGSWIWPGAVGYYLRQHGVPPETELLSHIRRLGFQVPEVDEQLREQAVTTITGEGR
jgi:hypothetical protein